jgi:hypothetical protein
MKPLIGLLLYVLMASCCQVGKPTPPQYVLIKNYPTKDLVIASNYGLDLKAQGYGTDFLVSIENGDSLCYINPINTLNNGFTKMSDKVFLFNKRLNRTDTILVKYSIQKIDSCNEYLKIEEAYLNGKKGVIGKTKMFDEIIELK